MNPPGKRLNPNPRDHMDSDWLLEVKCGSALLFQPFAEHLDPGFKGQGDLLPFRRHNTTISNFVATVPFVPSSHHKLLNLFSIFCVLAFSDFNTTSEILTSSAAFWSLLVHSFRVCKFTVCLTTLNDPITAAVTSWQT